ncbi:Pr6Pr family membrane protein [Ferruginibacter lapsinanis]|uniref:Pr6Pr family membrane protein n=1 Tax=Ferruginibacter lapsinanis TaxID=563172 RepID=UPI001E555FE6|nr:Pr6Pr family membrane protein [Ferruginibacter lapsinanis]UEG50173.1 Pr6Pr family membrane protein [Ferruginibacter lapsinanis]
MPQQNLSGKVYLAIVGALGWFALIAQFYINITSKIASTPELLIRYFSYFTILTNIIVAVCCTTLSLLPDSRWGLFFSKQKTFAAVTVYIFVVGLVYNVILRFLWNPQGLQRIVDELLHSVIPVMFLLYWLVLMLKDELHFKSIFPWLIYPFVYAVFVIFRGSVSGFYPYPFIDVSQIGMTRALFNAVMLTVLFYFISALFVVIGRMENKKKRHR